MLRPYYEERQAFAPWVYLILLATMVTATVGVAVAVSLDDSNWTALAVFAIIMANIL